MLRWFRPKRVYIVWETSPDPRGVVAMENIFYDEKECQRHVNRAQAAWDRCDPRVQVYYTSQVVL